jgi:hypothetical protein
MLLSTMLPDAVARWLGARVRGRFKHFSHHGIAGIRPYGVDAAYTLLQERVGY